MSQAPVQDNGMEMYSAYYDNPTFFSYNYTLNYLLVEVGKLGTREDGQRPPLLFTHLEKQSIQRIHIRRTMPLDIHNP